MPEEINSSHTRHRHVFQLIDEELYTCGLFDTVEAARQAALGLKACNPAKRYQVNRIPMNTPGHYGQIFDVVIAMS